MTKKKPVYETWTEYGVEYTVVEHPDVDGQASVPTSALEIHQGQGWTPVEVSEVDDQPVDESRPRRAATTTPPKEG